MFAIERLAAAVELHEVAPPARPSRAALAEADAVWARERTSRGPSLFEGRVFSLAGREGARYTGWFADYKLWLAQLREPRLREALGVFAVGVCGVLRFGDHVLLGRRGAGVTQLARHWELAPCGSLDPSARMGGGRVSPERQLARELEEELGVPPERVRALRPLLWIEDPATRVGDLVFEIGLDFGPDELAASFRARGDGEISELRLVHASEIEALGREPEVSPFALAVLGSDVL